MAYEKQNFQDGNPLMAEELNKMEDAIVELQENPPVTEETDPTVPAWAKQPAKPAYTASEVGADPAGTASSAVAGHNINTEAHADIRLLIADLRTMVTNFLDSDDITLDELSELITAIKANAGTIEQLTTGKVNVTDIVDDLVTNVANRPLSAARGVVLKGLIDALSAKLANYQPKGDYALRSELPTVPTKVSAFENDKGYLTQHQDISGKLDADKLPEAINDALAQAKESGEFKGDKGETGPAGSDANVTAENIKKALGYTPADAEVVSQLSSEIVDYVEILLPSELVAVTGVELNAYYKSFILSNRPLDNFEVKCYLNDTSLPYKLYKECFRLTAAEENVGSYTLTVQVKDIISGSVKAEKTVAFYIIRNRTLNTKNVLYLGDSLTFSRGGLYPAEIQYNLSGGKLVSIGSQTRSAESNGIGEVKHEGYNGATIGGFLSANVTSEFVNPFYNPDTGEFDLAYFLTQQGYSGVDAVCLNLGHNNIGNHVTGVTQLKTIISKIHEYNADIPILVSLIAPMANQDGWVAKTKNTAEEMRRHWKGLIAAYITAFDNNAISNVYLSTPYLNVDQDNDFPTETVARSARDATEIVRQSDAMHPSRIGTLKMADAYYANLLYRIPEDDATYYTVANNLTNVTNSNTVGSVKEGASYSATLTPADGYVLDSVTVTMGGNPVTVANGEIGISSVTGNIVITATAKVYVPSYTNLADPSKANDAYPNTALTADEWLNGYYISSKKISAKADLIVINKIPLTASQKLRVKGIATTGTIGGSSCVSRFRILPCDASGNALVTEIQPALESGQYIGQMDAAELEKGIYCFTPNELEQASYWANVAFVRICGYPIDGNNANVIVTVNELIE